MGTLKATAPELIEKLSELGGLLTDEAIGNLKHSAYAGFEKIREMVAEARTAATGDVSVLLLAAILMEIDGQMEEFRPSRDLEGENG